MRAEEEGDNVSSVQDGFLSCREGDNLANDHVELVEKAHKRQNMSVFSLKLLTESLHYSQIIYGDGNNMMPILNIHCIKTSESCIEIAICHTMASAHVC
jgi:hypothetical protein